MPGWPRAGTPVLPRNAAPARPGRERRLGHARRSARRPGEDGARRLPPAALSVRRAGRVAAPQRGSRCRQRPGAVAGGRGSSGKRRAARARSLLARRRGTGSPAAFLWALRDSVLGRCFPRRALPRAVLARLLALSIPVRWGPPSAEPGLRRRGLRGVPPARRRVGPDLPYRSNLFLSSGLPPRRGPVRPPRSQA